MRMAVGPLPPSELESNDQLNDGNHLPVDSPHNRALRVPARSAGLSLVELA